MKEEERAGEDGKDGGSSAEGLLLFPGTLQIFNPSFSCLSESLLASYKSQSDGYVRIRGMCMEQGLQRTSPSRDINPFMHVSEHWCLALDDGNMRR